MEIKKPILIICLILLCFFNNTVYVKANANALILADNKAPSSAAKDNSKQIKSNNVNKPEVKNKNKSESKSIKINKPLVIIVILIAVIILSVIVYLALRKKGKSKNNMILEAEKPLDVPPLSFGNAQNIGKREDQQDSFAISDCDDELLVNEKGVFAIVADGMGGLDNGKVSSSLVVDSMMRYFNEKKFISVIPIELRNMLVNANNELLNHLSERGNIKSGSTVVSVIVKGNELYWISIGDSRIYLYRNKKVYTLNRDHVYGAELFLKAMDGDISFEEALNHPDRKALTSYMGISEITEIDQNIKPFKLLPEDKIILCTDGVYGSLNETEIIDAMENNAPHAAFNLEEKVLAKNMKGQDNMTAIVIGYKETNLC